MNFNKTHFIQPTNCFTKQEGGIVRNIENNWTADRNEPIETGN